jgi:hypothetical protein
LYYSGWIYEIVKEMGRGGHQPPRLEGKRSKEVERERKNILI